MRIEAGEAHGVLGNLELQLVISDSKRWGAALGGDASADDSLSDSRSEAQVLTEAIAHFQTSIESLKLLPVS